MKQQIYQLELSLLEPSVRQSVPQLETLISAQFTEFGSSGKIYGKKDIIETLPLETSEEFSNPSRYVEGLTVTELSPDVGLVTYKLTIDSITTLRSSIWKNLGGNWQLLFHQGTVCKKKT